MVAGAALTAALALAALPGIAGSAGPTPASAIDPAAFQSIQVPAFATAIGTAAQLDSAYVSAGHGNAQTIFTEPGAGLLIKTTARPPVVLPVAHGGSALKPPRYKVSGYATFYANG